MKKNTSKLNGIFILFMGIVTFSCNEKLPEETMEGAHTLGMYVNDELWTPIKPTPLGLYDRRPTITYYTQNDVMKIFGRHDKDNRYEEIYLYIDMGNAGYRILDSLDICSRYACYTSMNYQLNNESNNYNTDSNCYRVVDHSSVHFNFTRIDTLHKIVSGTFEMVLENALGEQLRITDGRFDSQYLKK